MSPCWDRPPIAGGGPDALGQRTPAQVRVASSTMDWHPKLFTLPEELTFAIGAQHHVARSQIAEVGVLGTDRA